MSSGNEAVCRHPSVLLDFFVFANALTISPNSGQALQKLVDLALLLMKALA
jgi:hypothetical protein